MPRVTIKKKDYKLKDFKGWVDKQRRIHGLKQIDVAKALGISQQGLSARLKVEDGKMPDPFSYGDLLTLFDLFETTDEEKLYLMKL